jgi:limonene-1,2-epoxide hydrolase
MTTLPNPVRPAFVRGERDDAVIVNIGLAPATHGTIQVIAMLDGEKVQRVDVPLRLPATAGSRRSAKTTRGTT